MENFLIKYVRCLYELDKINSFFIFNFDLESILQSGSLNSIYFPNFVFMHYFGSITPTNFRKLELALQIESVNASSNILKEIARLESIEIHTFSKGLIKKLNFSSLKNPHTVEQIDDQLLKYFDKILSKIEIESI